MFFPFWVTDTVTVFEPLTVIDPERSFSALASAVTSMVVLPVPEVLFTWIQPAEGVAVQSFSVVTYISLIDASSASKVMDSGFTVRVSLTTGSLPLGLQVTQRKRAARMGSMGKSFRIMVLDI